MKTFDKIAAQGDMMLIRIAALPEGLKEVPAENGQHVLAHSETGHNHVVMDRPAVKHFAAMDDLRQMAADGVSYLVVDGDEPVELQHLRSFDTHESVEIKPGTYEVRRQREYTPEGFRRAAD